MARKDKKKEKEKTLEETKLKMKLLWNYKLFKNTSIKE